MARRPVIGPQMDGVDLDGPLIRYFPLAAPRAELFEQACADDRNCGGYTYVKPGAYNRGDSPMCYLNAQVNRTLSNPRTISGIVQSR